MSVHIMPDTLGDVSKKRSFFIVSHVWDNMETRHPNNHNFIADPAYVLIFKSTLFIN